jgi:hypothetical protein
MKLNSLRKSNELAEFIGILISDGGISFGPSSKEIFFVGTSSELARRFSKLSNEIFGINPRRIFRKTRTFKDVYDLRIRSDKAISFILGLMNTCRTRPCHNTPSCPKLRNRSYQSCLECKPVDHFGKKYPMVKIPDFITMNKKYSRYFLRMVFTCDGGVSLYPRTGHGKLRIERELFLGCRHPLLRKEYVKLLSTFQIRSMDKPKKGKVLIRDLKNMRKFRKEIGFIPNVKATGDSKYWEGLEKNKFLGFAIRTSEMSKQLSPGLWTKFNSKNEILNHLKSKL